MKHFSTQAITINALAMALVCLSTMFLQFPIPLGYANLGNCFILIISVFFGPVTGLLAGGIGSAMADLLTGYSQWVLPTLITIGLMGLSVGILAHRTRNFFAFHKLCVKIAPVVGIFIMIIGYFIGGSILYGSFYVGATQLPALIAEAVIGIV